MWHPFRVLIYHCNLYPLQAVNCCRNSRLVVDEGEVGGNKKNISLSLEQFHENVRSKTPISVGN